MKKLKPALLIPLAFVVVAVVVMARSSQAGEPFVDMSYEAALTQAGGEGKLVFIAFSGTWCPPCKMMNATTWKNGAVRAALREHTIPLHVDAEQHRELTGQFDVRAVPTLLLLAPDGKVLHRAEGYLGADAFLKEFGEALRDHPSNR